MLFLEVDPSTVKPGWTPLIITILLAAAIVLLMLSMRRQIRKIRVPHRDDIDETGPDRTTGNPPAEVPGEEASDADPESDGGPGSDPTSRGTAGRRHPIGQG